MASWLVWLAFPVLLALVYMGLSTLLTDKVVYRRNSCGA